MAPTISDFRIIRPENNMRDSPDLGVMAYQKCSAWIVNALCGANETREQSVVFACFLTVRTSFECKFCSTCHLRNIREMYFFFSLLVTIV